MEDVFHSQFDCSRILDNNWRVAGKELNYSLKQNTTHILITYSYFHLSHDSLIVRTVFVHTSLRFSHSFRFTLHSCFFRYCILFYYLLIVNAVFFLFRQAKDAIIMCSLVTILSLIHQYFWFLLLIVSFALNPFLV